MKLRLLLGICVFAGASLALVQAASASDKKTSQKRETKGHDDHKGHDHDAHAGGEHAGHDHAEHAYGEGGTDADAAMMAEWMKMMAPGEHHEHLKAFVGSWKYALKWRMMPDGDWTESVGTSENKEIMDGRYVFQKVEGNSMGMPFNGIGITGYDNLKKQYVNTWIDNMGTGMMMTMGTCDNSGKSFVFKGTMDDPMSGQKDMPIKETLKIINHDKHVLEWYQPGPDGKMYMSMEITYTRQ